MKRIFTITLMALLAIAIAVPAQAKKKQTDGTPVMQFEKESHDFGVIPAKGAVKTEFEFVNTGNAPLVIFDATADCGCTRPEFPKNPIAPGKKGKIKVTFIPVGYRGGFVKNVKVKSNSKPKTKVLKISGTVNPN